MSVAFEVERFERVDASSGTVLLRLAGTFRADAATEFGAPQLVVDGRRTRRVPPLPDPAAAPPAAEPGGRSWRAAFAVASELLEGHRVAYALGGPGAGVIALPQRARMRPSPRRRGPAAPAPRRAVVDVDWLERQAREAAALREDVEHERRRAEALR